jgi:hypothetical protein
MGRGSICHVWCSIYQGWEVLYTIGRRFDIPWIRGSKYHGLGVRYTRCRGFKLPLVEDSIYNG